MSANKKSPRRLGRERALQILFGCSFAPASRKECVLRTFDNFVRGTEAGKRNRQANSFAWELICGVVENMQDLDQIIRRFSQNWRLDRIAPMELAVLRLSLYEMLYRHDIPLKVAINEGIELSKKFGDDKSGRFVNGILDAAASKINSGELSYRQDRGNNDAPLEAE